MVAPRLSVWVTRGHWLWLAPCQRWANNGNWVSEAAVVSFRNLRGNVQPKPRALRASRSLIVRVSRAILRWSIQSSTLSCRAKYVLARTSASLSWCNCIRKWPSRRQRGQQQRGSSASGLQPFASPTRANGPSSYAGTKAADRRPNGLRKAPEPVRR